MWVLDQRELNKGAKGGCRWDGGSVLRRVCGEVGRFRQRDEFRRGAAGD